jgi:hypothetical protein
VDGVSELTPSPDDSIPPARFALRATWVAVQVAVVIYLGQPGALFFYQLF